MGKNINSILDNHYQDIADYFKYKKSKEDVHKSSNRFMYEVYKLIWEKVIGADGKNVDINCRLKLQRKSLNKIFGIGEK